MQNKRFIKIIFLSLGCCVAVSQRMDTVKSMLISDWQRAKILYGGIVGKNSGKKVQLQDIGIRGIYQRKDGNTQILW